MIEFGVLWVTTGVVSLWLLVRLAAWLLRLGDGWLNRVSEWLPRFLHPVERTLTIIVVMTLTGLILAFPEFGAWSFVVADSHANDISPVTLLGAAAALLALLLFAANQLHTVQKDSGTGRTYLGENVGTYGTSRSRATRLLGEPVFHLAVLALFLLPLLQAALPTDVTMPPWGPIPEISFAQQPLALALWCACFALVGAVLIFNVLKTLRSSAVGIILPQSVEWRIEDVIEESSRAAYARLFRPSKRQGRFDVERWVKHQLHKTSVLPHDEQIRYLRLTVGSIEYAVLRSTSFQRSEATAYGALQTSNLPTITSGTLRGILGRNREKRALDTLRQTREVAYGRSSALLEYLRLDGFSNEVKEWIVSQCLQEARVADQMYSHLFENDFETATSSIDRSSESYPMAARAEILTIAANVPTLESHRWIPPSATTFGPMVEMIPAFIFQSLAELLSARNESRRVHLPEAVLGSIMETANDVHHNETREHALRQVIGGTISALITDRHHGTLAWRGMLRNLTARRGEVLTKGQATTGDRTPLEKVITQSAFGSLLSHNYQDAEADEELLTLIDGWRLPAAVLYRLHYAQRSHEPLSAADLRPFREPLTHRWVGHLEDDSTFITDCVHFLCSSRIHYFVTNEGITWLLESLRYGFTLVLCSAFLDQREQGSIRDFGLREFLLWRLVTNRASGPYESASKSAISDEHWAQIVRFLPELRTILEEWRALDERAVVDVEVTFFPLTRPRPSQREH